MQLGPDTTKRGSGWEDGVWTGGQEVSAGFVYIGLGTQMSIFVHEEAKVVSLEVSQA